MLKKVVFATNNKHKIQEVQQILEGKFQLLSLNDIGCNEEIPEDFFTLEENASQKAWHIYNKFSAECFADDTGLEVEVLGGEPGVLSARYAGDQKNSEENMRLLLTKLNGNNNRNAQFRTVISLIIKGKEFRFEGVVKGKITFKPDGVQGFGYDPIFIPNGYHQTFAQMNSDQKNKISHRAIALSKLSDFLLSL